MKSRLAAGRLIYAFVPDTVLRLNVDLLFGRCSNGLKTLVKIMVLTASVSCTFVAMDLRLTTLFSAKDSVLEFTDCFSRIMASVAIGVALGGTAIYFN